MMVLLDFDLKILFDSFLLFAANQQQIIEECVTFSVSSLVTMSIDIQQPVKHN